MRLDLTRVIFAMGFSILTWLGCVSAAPIVNPAKYESTSKPLAYPVKFTVAYNDRILGSPSLYVREGQSTIITVPRQGGYALRATLNRQIMQNRVMARLDLEVFREDQGRWHQISTPVLMMPYGGRAEFTLDRPGGGQPIFRLDAVMGQPIAAVIGKNNCTASKQANWNASMKAPVMLIAGLAQDVPPDSGGGNCCQGGCFRCCGPAACCADPRNCSGSCCT